MFNGVCVCVGGGVRFNANIGYLSGNLEKLGVGPMGVSGASFLRFHNVRNITMETFPVILI